MSTNQAAVRGLSPRVRGNLLMVHARSSKPRSIPACAGEPKKYLKQRHYVRVYPRVCGGTSSSNRMCSL